MNPVFYERMTMDQLLELEPTEEHLPAIIKTLSHAPIGNRDCIILRKPLISLLIALGETMGIPREKLDPSTPIEVTEHDRHAAKLLDQGIDPQSGKSIVEGSGGSGETSEEASEGSGEISGETSEEASEGSGEISGETSEEASEGSGEISGETSGD